MAFTEVTVTGTFTGPNPGTPAVGEVTFVLNSPMSIPGVSLIPQRTVRVTLDQTGSLPAGFKLYATDDPGVQPDGVAYIATPRIDGAETKQLYFNLSHLDATFDLSEATLAAPAAAIQAYATQAALAAVDAAVLHKTGADQTATANTDFQGLLTRNGQNAATDVRFNVLEEGPANNASVNEAYAKAGAAAAAGLNAVVWLPTGLYTFTPDPVTGISVPLVYPGVRFEGLGRIKTADGAGAFAGHFGAPDFDTDTSGVGFRGLTFDANLANNPIALEAELLDFFGDWRTRRNPILSAIGTGMYVDECQFIDSPRQSVMWPGREPGDIDRCWVRNCDLLTTVSETDTNHDWDTTSIFIRGDGCDASKNVLTGSGTTYYISRTAIQISGPRASANYNKFDKYYRMIILGNPGYPGSVEDIQACGNQATNANGGIEFQSLDYTGYTSGPAVRGVKICNNQISTNEDTYHRAVGDGGTPYGIMQRGDPGTVDRPVELVDISGNTIIHDPAYTAGGGHGIAFAKDPDNDDPLDSSLRYLTMKGNVIVNAGRNGIAVRANALLVARLADNTVVDCATRAAIAAPNCAALRVTGDVTALKVDGLDVIDTRSTHLTLYGVYLDCSALRGSRAQVDKPYMADGTTIPAVFANNATSLLRVDDLHPRVVAISDDYTLTGTDDGAVIEVNKGTAVTVTIPPAVTAAATVWSNVVTYVAGQFVSSGASFYKAIAGSLNVVPGTDATKWVLAVPWPTNATVELYQVAAGQVTVVAGSGVTVRVPNGAKTAKQYATIAARYRGSDIWVVSGDTTT